MHGKPFLVKARPTKVSTMARNCHRLTGIGPSVPGFKRGSIKSAKMTAHGRLEHREANSGILARCVRCKRLCSLRSLDAAWRNCHRRRNGRRAGWALRRRPCYFFLQKSTQANFCKSINTSASFCRKNPSGKFLLVSLEPCRLAPHLTV